MKKPGFNAIKQIFIDKKGRNSPLFYINSMFIHIKIK